MIHEVISDSMRYSRKLQSNFQTGIIFFIKGQFMPMSIIVDAVVEA